MRRSRFRERFFFWLDVSKDDELLLAEQIDELKKRRQFTGAIRNGMRLFLDLKAGRVDVLRELFPWVFEAVASALEEERVANSDAIQLQLERIEKFLIEQGNIPIDRPLTALASGPKRLDVPQFSVPFDDENEETPLDIRALQGTDSAQNFVNAVLAISAAGG